MQREAFVKVKQPCGENQIDRDCVSLRKSDQYMQPCREPTGSLRVESMRRKASPSQTTNYAGVAFNLDDEVSTKSSWSSSRSLSRQSSFGSTQSTRSDGNQMTVTVFISPDGVIYNDHKKGTQAFTATIVKDTDGRLKLPKELIDVINQPKKSSDKVDKIEVGHHDLIDNKQIGVEASSTICNLFNWCTAKVAHVLHNTPVVVPAAVASHAGGGKLVLTCSPVIAGATAINPLLGGVTGVVIYFTGAAAAGMITGASTKVTIKGLEIGVQSALKRTTQSDTLHQIKEAVKEGAATGLSIAFIGQVMHHVMALQAVHQFLHPSTPYHGVHR